MIERDISRPFRFIFSVILTIVLAVAVKINAGYLNFLDSSVRGTLQSHHSNFQDILYKSISFIASPKMTLLWVFIIAFILWGFKFKLPAVFSIGLVLGGDFIGFILKEIIQRPRPTLHLPSDDGYSFPSGHTLGFVLLAAVFWVVIIPLIKKQFTRFILKLFVLILVILVMISRIYLSAHFPSDTVAAFLVAYAWLQFSKAFYIRHSRKMSQMKIFRNSYF
ncbi:phosphatase PAP2 family protein [Lactobacillus sp. S2-2]|uniref:phosphatase PAP2 family protein n=1 Tax=Lactobacillus sp. S2-2 TaxID=2692917 RepID=UPI001F3DE7F5|nr:phosphatase PAP2 family protein [Lactobacillus sp. S2-2]MCF6514750.1 phosphatase PAP2 family protein [Lactobacillus sp. S2-2]